MFYSKNCGLIKPAHAARQDKRYKRRIDAVEAKVIELLGEEAAHSRMIVVGACRGAWHARKARSSFEGVLAQSERQLGIASSEHRGPC